jgi:hypothetical protein
LERDAVDAAASGVRRNAVISHRRAPIEPLFALLKSVYGFARARYREILLEAGWR